MQTLSAHKQQALSAENIGITEMCRKHGALGSALCGSPGAGGHGRGRARVGVEWGLGRGVPCLIHIYS